MSVIIRLQNLPWAANAADIRAYFSGLSIPEGGVHIVGGEQGDAFIAFSTDEDARQAMLLDGGKLKEVKIKLFLSSRTEMLRVIEQARQQTLSVHNIIHGATSSTAAPVAATSSVTAPIASAPISVTQKQEINKDDDQKSNDDNSRDKRDRYRSSSRDRDRDRSRGRYRDRRRRDRSRSRDRHRRRSRSRDRRRNSREKDGKDLVRNKRNGKEEAVDTKESPRADDPAYESTNIPPIAPKIPILPDPPAVPSTLLQMPHVQNGKEISPPTVPVMNFPSSSQEAPSLQYNPQAFMHMRGRDGWNPSQMVMDPLQMGMPRPPLLGNLDIGMPGFPPPYGMSPMFHGANPNDPNAIWRPPMMQAMVQEPIMKEQEDLCVEIRGLPLSVSYIDVKKLFDGLSIPSDGIKMINDNHGNRTGIAYVRFSNTVHKKAALNQNGKKVRSNVVEVIHLKDSLFLSSTDNFKPDKEKSGGRDEMENTSGNWSKNMDRDRGNEKDRGRGEDRSRRNGDPRMSNTSRLNEPNSHSDPRSSRFTSDPRMNNDQRMNTDPRGVNNPRMSKPLLDHIPENHTECVLLQGLPLDCTENDIADFFEELDIVPVNIYLVFDNMRHPLGDAFCEFTNFEEAKKATLKNNASMGPHNVSVRLIAKEEMDRAVIHQPSWGIPPRHLPGLIPPGPLRGPGRGGVRMPPGPPYNDRFGEGDTYFNEREMHFPYDRGMDDDRPERFRGRPDDSARILMPRERGGGGGHLRGRGRGRGGFKDPYLRRDGPLLPLPRIRGNREPSPFFDNNALEVFGRPGCVVSLENIHFRAEVDEIIDFFKGFSVDHENIIRRFDESGRPTGDARVSLTSPPEAERAVKILNFKMLRGRPVKVSLFKQGL